MTVDRKDERDEQGEAGGHEFLRVAEELRARMADGFYPVDTYLPSQVALAKEFGVSRDTVQRALRVLRGEGWIQSRQGKGSRVVRNQRIQSTTPRASRSRRQLTLGPLIAEAFEQPEVSLDIYTLTSESLNTHIHLQAERIRAGFIAPRRIALRLIVPSGIDTLPYPRGVHDGKDDVRLRTRLRSIAETHIASLDKVLGELHTEKLVPSVEYEFRHLASAPMFKLYIINRSEVLHGPYIPIVRPVMLDMGEEVQAVDVLGLGATLTHHVHDGRTDSTGSTFVGDMTAWFEATWQLLTDESARAGGTDGTEGGKAGTGESMR
ncbi:GntR family transcriptional regulator [Streptomyces sp. MUSC 14]|uniref:GntR family transcriptional regulator n=1 Tax=Streptomyces sp. MUSC 14 TaxID=1354889 RepID=UPI0008F5B3F4|nr:GntR family transcriptional regulator [Streptomyces sp. MUSC 14]OIJ86559.1 GntR family transcriptional regulator [Streptomyces sp. MUSC 14]